MCIDTGKVPEGILDLGTTHAITVAVAAEVTAAAALSVPKLGSVACNRSLNGPKGPCPG